MPWGLTPAEEQAVLDGDAAVSDMVMNPQELYFQALYKWATTNGRTEVTTRMDLLQRWAQTRRPVDTQGVVDFVNAAPVGQQLGSYDSDKHLRELAASQSAATSQTDTYFGEVGTQFQQEVLNVITTTFQEAIENDIRRPRAAAAAPAAAPPAAAPALPWGLTSAEANELRQGIDGGAFEDLERGTGTITSIFNKWATATNNRQAEFGLSLWQATKQARDTGTNEALMELAQLAPTGWLGRNEQAIRKFVESAYPDAKMRPEQTQWVDTLYDYYRSLVVNAWMAELHPAAEQAGLS